MKNALILIIILSFISCSKTTPSGFWLNYEKKLITAKQNDQGPFGGRLSVNWVADKDSEFDIKIITEFADKNDWKLIDSTTYSKTELIDMTDFGKPTTKLPIKIFTPKSKKSRLDIGIFSSLD
ncbi:hypothetical protein [Bizionia psychrotolerans]|uniref:hypothetical protein n=1 Tax=Bizionia psychrotolerans TaxID=1492901 RepID=UPI0006508837|nr:hypothetical protein [Bizionia psychrotolerans]